MTKIIEIEIINAVECRIDRSKVRHIVGAILYQKSFWQDTPRGKRQKFYDFALWTRKSSSHFYFLTGHLKKVLAHCRENNVKAKVIGTSPSLTIQAYQQPELDGIIFRSHQQKALIAAMDYKRGIIKAPTRTGKTVIQYGIYNAFNVNTLIIAHSLDLVQQLAQEGRKFGFIIHEIHGKRKDLNWNKRKSQVVVMTRRTANLMFKKKENKWMADFFKMVLIDEAHHVTTPDGEYAKILKFIKAPIRFGFTATLPDTIEKKFCLEGFIGPLIYDLSINDAVQQDLIVSPKIKLIKTETKRIPVSTTYQNVYKIGIVENEARHNLIVEKTIEYITKGMSVLILVNKIDHGIYQQYAFARCGMKVPFVFGDTLTDEREKIKKDLIDKKILCVIVSVVWKEGIDIPTLDVCINAAGGVSEIATLQGVGRSLTKADGKKQAIIVDVFDQCHHYLIRHFGERISLYMEQGWL